MLIIQEDNLDKDIDIDIEKTKCLVCKEAKQCLMVDTADGEYNRLYICLDCINHQFEVAKMVSEGISHHDLLVFKALIKTYGKDKLMEVLKKIKDCGGINEM